MMGGGLNFSFLSCFVFIKVVKAGELHSKKCPIEPIVLSIICNFNPNTSGGLEDTQKMVTHTQTQAVIDFPCK